MFQKPLLKVSPLSGQGPLLKWWCWWQEDIWGCMNSNVSQTSPAGGTKGEKHKWQCWRKGQRFPSEQGDNILHCTAPSKTSACQSVPSSQGSTASRPEGPSRGGFSVLFQCILPPFSPNSLLCLMWWNSLGLVVLPLWGRLLPSCSSTQCLQMNHDLLTTVSSPRGWYCRDQKPL